MRKPLFDLPPGLRIRRGRLHYRFMLAGAEYTGSTGYAATERNLPRAMKSLEAVREKVLAGEASSIKLAPKPFSDAATMFNDWANGEYSAHPATARRLAVSMTSLSAFFGKAALHSINPGQVEDYKAWRRAAGIKEITLRHDLHALSKLYQYGAKHNWCRRNVARDVAIPSDAGAVRQHVLSTKEETKYFVAALRDQDLFDLARLMLLQGLRPSEVLGLRVEDVDCNARVLHVRAGKTAAARRTLRLVPESASICARRAATGGAWLFRGRGAGHLQKLNKRHDDACGLAGVAFVLYDLRHTFATRMAEAGCPLATLAAILGHANLRTIHRYVHPSRQAQWDAMEQFGVQQKLTKVYVESPENEADTEDAGRSGIGPGTARDPGDFKGSPGKEGGGSGKRSRLVE